MGVTQAASMRISVCVDLSNIYMKKIGGNDVGHMLRNASLCSMLR